MIYPLILILVLLLAVWRGWRKGMIYQVASLLGLGFGIVAARMFADAAMPVAEIFIPAEKSEDSADSILMRDYLTATLAAALVFSFVYLAFRLFAGLLNSALKLLHMGAVNSILGAAFNLCKWVLIMSIVLNLWLGLNPDSGLLKPCTDGDGNIVELVMGVAPAMLDTESPEELEYAIRIEQARQLEAANLAPRYGVLHVCMNHFCKTEKSTIRYERIYA